MFTITNDTSVYRNPAPHSPLQGQNVMQPAAVYSSIMLKTIELVEADLEFAKLAEKRTMPANNGSNEIVFKRMLSLAAHTQPLVEGIPPASDQGRMVAIKATTRQYGRYMDFTDKVNWAVVDPLISEYTRQLSLKVPETKDLLAQEALLAECQYFYASVKEKEGDSWVKASGGDVYHVKYLTPDCVPTIDELRQIVLTMEAAKVRPLLGKNYLALLSPAVFFDLITDKRVQEFMKYENTARAYSEDTVIDLFSLAFRKAKTIKSDNTFMDANGEIKYLYHVSNLKNGDTYTGPANVISPKPYSELASGDKVTLVPLTKTSTGAYPNSSDVTKTVLEGYITAGSGTIDAFNIHYSYILGEEALFEVTVEGHGSPEFITKPLGSAGTSDPLNQKQSIGWKLDAIGYKVANPDAVQAYLSVPTQYRINMNARPDYKNQFVDYDYGYVDATGKFYYPAQVVQSVYYDGSTQKVGFFVKGTTTQVTPQPLSKLIKPVNGGRMDANGKNQVVKGDLPSTAFALKSNKAIHFMKDQVVKHTDGKFYIKGLAGTATAEVVELPATGTESLPTSDGSTKENKTVVYTSKEDGVDN